MLGCILFNSDKPEVVDLEKVLRFDTEEEALGYLGNNPPEDSHLLVAEVTKAKDVMYGDYKVKWSHGTGKVFNEAVKEWN